MPSKATATIKTTGAKISVSPTDNFGKITYTKAGVYGYKITETSKNGWSQSPASATVYVKVEDNGTALSVTGLYSDSACKNQYKDNLIVFTNTYDLPNPNKEYSSTTMTESTVLKGGDFVEYKLS